MKKIYKFSAGPAMLSPFVLEATSQATIEYNDHGMSLMEMSHRSQPVVNMVKETELLVRELLQLPQHYQVLFLQGGASLQFSMIPMNLLGSDQVADYTDTGAWAYKAIAEAQEFGKVNIVCSSKDSSYNHIPKNLKRSKNAVYLHLTSNNTIYGTQWASFPNLDDSRSYLIADMSSDIFSREFDITDFGLI